MTALVAAWQAGLITFDSRQVAQHRYHIRPRGDYPEMARLIRRRLRRAYAENPTARAHALGLAQKHGATLTPAQMAELL